MKKLITFFTLALLFIISSCKKETVEKDDHLENYAKEIKIYPINVYAQETLMSFVETFTDSKITPTFQYRQATDSVWKNAVYTDKNNISIKDLTPNTKYDFRVMVSQGTYITYSSTLSITTKPYSINHAKFYDGPANLHDEANGIFSIEGAHYVISGIGFTNVPSIKVVLTAVDNISDIVNLPATIINDSTLSFDIPADLIPNLPYVRNKVYSLFIGDVPLVGYNNYLNNYMGISGDLIVVNRDIMIDKFTLVPATCSILTFGGNFATHEIEGKTPSSLYGVSLGIKERKLIIRNGSSIIEEIMIKSSGSATCDGDGHAVADPIVLSKAMMAYHEVTSVVIRTTIGTGTYSAQMKETALDGTVLLSNEFPFAL